MKLNIKPMVYDGKNLDFVGEGIVSAFEPLIHDFDLLEGVNFLETRLFNMERISGWEFLAYMRKYGAPILSLTNLHLENSEDRDKTVFGLACQCFKSAVVSDSSAAFAKGTEDYLEKILVISVHEVGHLFGLEHHEDYRVTKNGKLCPMSTYHRQAARNGLITWSDYISLRDIKLCDSCYNGLKQ